MGKVRRKADDLNTGRSCKPGSDLTRIKLTDDWHGADFLVHHFDGTTTLKVQLKARLTIDRKNAGRDL